MIPTLTEIAFWLASLLVLGLFCWWARWDDRRMQAGAERFQRERVHPFLRALAKEHGLCLCGHGIPGCPQHPAVRS